MRRRLILATLVAGFAVAPALPAEAQAPAGDSVVGQLVDGSQFVGFSIDAHSGPSGENPTGTAGLIIAAPYTASLSVTCLSVTGTTAVVGFSGVEQLDREGVFIVPIAGLIRVVDGGGPDSGRDTFEWALVRGSVRGPPIPGPTSCASYPGSFEPETAGVRNETGDIVVVDAQGLPTSKEQCKNGGWRNYGVFKNQGDCGSFVATGGKNQPSGP